MDWQAVLRTLSMGSPEAREQLLSDLSCEAAAGDTRTLRSVAGLPSRFDVLRRIGQGGFGAVYEAFDRDANRHVALKVLRHLHPDSLFRFKQEFRVLADLRHPNLVELYELFEMDRAWFFTMELVRGESFISYVRPSGRCDYERLRRAVGDLASVLAFLHSSDIVHRDIKPDNVMVSESGRLVLLDFGLPRHLAPHTNSATISVGTPAYMAPEQLSDVPVTPAADYYAVGTLIYVALTGRPPFEGTVVQVLAAKSSQDPAPPSALTPDVPPEWEQVCRRLLDRNPEARPAASELLALLPGDPGPVALGRLRAHALFGRDSALARLIDACRSAPAFIEITGPSGCGKTALLQAFAAAVPQRIPTSLVLRGSCHEHESVPFKALDALVDDITRHLQRTGASACRSLPPDMPALARLFPVLGRVEALVPALRPDAPLPQNPAELRRRAFIGFAELLAGLAQDRLLVLCLDDLHWGDAESAALFQHLYALQPVPPFVLAVTCRSGAEGELLPLLRRHLSAAAPRVTVCTEVAGPLDLADAAEAARCLLERHGMPAAEAETLALNSQGNPLLLEQLVASLARSSSEAAPGLRGATLSELVVERVSRLSTAAREFLQMLACVGEPVPESIALHLPRSAADTELLATLVSQRLVRSRDVHGAREVDICHDQIRAALLSAVPDEVRRALHLRIAQSLIEAGWPDPGTVAVQLARGGKESLAAEYAARAAGAAESVLAFDRAAQFYGMALALAGGQGQDTLELHERLARACAAAGRGADAARAWEETARLAPTPGERVEFRRRAAEEWIRGGSVRQGVLLLLSLGREFRISQTDSTVAAFASIAASRLALRIRGFHWIERPESDIPPRDLARLDVYWALTAGLSLWNPVLGAACQLRHLRLALRAGEPRRLGLALATEAAYRCLSGESQYADARSLLNQALAIGNRLSNPAIVGTAQAMSGMCGWLTGRWDVARESGLEGERTLREHCSAVPWQLSIARNAALGGLLWSGQWKEYSRRLAEWTRDAEERGDLNALSACRMNHAPVSLAADNPGQAAADLEEAERILAQAWSGRGFHVPHFFGVFGGCGVELYRDAPAADLGKLEPRIRRLRHSPLQRIEVIRVLTAYIDALVALAIAAGSPGRKPALLKKAAARTRTLRGMRAIWSLGLAMLIEAGIEAANGRPDAAAARWADAERELSRSGMAMYAAAAQLYRARIACDRNLEAQASAAMARQGVVSPVPFAMSLAPGVPR